MTRQMTFALGVALTLLGEHFASAQDTAPITSPGGSQAAVAAAARDGKYVFVLFHKENDAATQAVRQTLDAALAKRLGQAVPVVVRASDPTEKSLVDQYGVSRSPMPLVLAVAPNGAVTGGFPLKVTEQEIVRAIVSPGTAACLKATQSRKLVLLCVQPAGVQVLPAGVREFKADAQYGPATEVVTLQADDPAEAALLQTLKVRPASSTITAFLVPPGSLLGTFDDTVTKQQFVEKLKSAQSRCCPGGKCGPGGCCPGGKCNPKQ